MLHPFLSNRTSVPASGRRLQTGQSLISLMMLVALVVIPLLGTLSFEIARLYLAKEELQNACDAAALAGSATLASSDNTNTLQAHQDASIAALKIFKANSILGQTLTNASVVASASGMDCNVGEAKVYLEFLNPITGAVEPPTSANGKTVRITSTAGSKLAFGDFVGIKSLTVNARSTSVVPKLDMVICFDVSGSMDDQTAVTFIKRKWDATLGAGKIVYAPVNSVNGPMNGRIFDILKPAATGTSLNATSPQILTEAYWNAKAYSSEYLAKYFGVPGLRSGGVYPEAGLPPGNCPPGVAPTFDGYNVFTDVVVNIDGQTTFGGFTYNGYSFPDTGTLVEAARGNLESTSLFAASKANTAVSVTPRPGYQKAYLDAARAQIKPMQDAQSALATMTQIINTDADTHFGFVSFDSSVGSDAAGTESWYNIDDYTPYGAQTAYPLPHVVLAGGSDSHFTDVNSAINSCVAMGATNIGGAVHAAVQDLKSNSRPGSTRVIVLFTDGEPTVPSGPLSSDPKANARMAAVEARDAGIALYTVGLAQNTAIIPDQKDILNDQNNDPTTGGMAAIAGHGGTFTLVTDSAQLRQSFLKIARRLVKLVSNS